ncbi:ImmA/IrrE family metallo-endopeptidase [Carnobacterium jeotgali]|uniref:ImmA/IrrE family metallo-endopeptidase n=1 Tax=Carnobacterium jeotgali TaxID=545534 RepID=UPI0004936EA9|nr:ImmA/IrrE family metallo-endopeptidase [Carnobacterium jeotgali]
MDSVLDLLKRNEVEMILISLDNNGYYDPSLKIIFINQSLNEEKQKEVILHELGHALNHKDLSALYNKPTFRFKMENEATSFMMKSLIDESEGHFNYSDVIENYNLGIGWECRLK